MPAANFRDRMAQLDRRILSRVGDPATLEDGTPLLGAFDNPFLDPQFGAKGGSGSLGMTVNADAVREPTFTLPAADAVGLVKGVVLIVNLPAAEGGGRYKVVRPEPDGSGLVALVLEVERERTADIT